VLELVDRDVGGEVVDAVQRLAEGECQRLGGGHTDQQRTRQSGTGRDGDRVDVVKGDARGLAGTLQRGDHRLEVRT
jgi:hypothetical protein